MAFILRWQLFFLLVFCSLSAAGQPGAPEMSNFSAFPVGAERISAQDSSAIMEIIERCKSLSRTEVDSALPLLTQAVSLSRKHRFPEGLVEGLADLSYCYITVGNYNKATLLLQEARQYLPELRSNHERLRALIYNHLGIVYNYLGQDDLALYYHFRSLSMLLRYGPLINSYQDKLVLVFLNIGLTLYRNHHVEQAFYYYQQAEHFALLYNKRTYLGDIYINMAKRFRREQRWAEHDAFARKALEACDSLQRIGAVDVNRQKIAILNSLGESCLAQKRPGTALAYFNKAKLSVQTKNPYDTLLTYKGIGTAYYQLGNRALAKRYLDDALEIQQRLGVRSYATTNLWETLAGLYHDLGDDGKAFQFYRRSAALSDSLGNEERSKMMQQMELNFRMKEKDASIAHQQLLLREKEREIRDKNLLVGAISLLLVLTFFAIAGIVRIRRHQEQIVRLQAQVEGEEQERARIGRELHDGIMVQFSAVKMNLSTLLSRYGDTPGIESFQYPLQLLDDATRELRRTAHNLMPAALLREGLVDAVHYFCTGLQQSTKINIRVQSYGLIPALHADFELSVYRIVQELVHNIIKHAQARNALVQLSVQHNLLMLSIEDDGVGLPANEHGQTEGMGLRMIRNRITTLGGTFEIRSNTGGGTVAYAEFDIENRIRENTAET
jgi:two-component system NarL family sensor kinase